MPLISPTATSKQYSGAHGNSSKAVLLAILAATPINETVIIGTFDAGTEIDEIRFNHANLGAGVVVDVGYQYLDGTVPVPTAFGSALAMSAAGVKRFEGVPVKLENRAQIFITVKGAVATGRIDALVEYRFVGVSHKLTP